MFKPRLPSVDELKNLPLRSIVAYAVRCARRVQPLYATATGIAHHEWYRAASDAALAMAEQVCRGELIAVEDAKKANGAVIRAGDVAINAEQDAARAAADAARIARDVADAKARQARAAAAASAKADEAVRVAKIVLDAATVEAARIDRKRDYERQAARAKYVWKHAKIPAIAREHKARCEFASARTAVFSAVSTEAAARADEAVAVAAAGAGRAVDAVARAASVRVAIPGGIAVEHAAAARADFSRLVSLNLGGRGQLGRPIDPGPTGPLGSLSPNEPQTAT